MDQVFKVLALDVDTVAFGKNSGLLSSVITLWWEKLNTSVNDLVEFVKESWMQRVLIQGSINDNPELKPFLVWITSLWYKVTVITECSDFIDAIRHIKGVEFLILFKLATKNENTINRDTINLLNEYDEIFVNIETVKEYEQLLKFTLDSVLIQPTIIMNIIGDKAEKIWDKAIWDLKRYRNINFRIVRN